LQIIWDIFDVILAEIDQRFRGTYFLHHQYDILNTQSDVYFGVEKLVKFVTVIGISGLYYWCALYTAHNYFIIFENLMLG
jgi:hypothetical protein